MAYTKIIAIKTNLNRAINYIAKADKTDDKILVGALNCRTEKAYNQMQEVKNYYDKKDGRLGYHLIQSFKHNEINPDAAFKIAEKYADTYIGDKYQVIFATHIDKEHIHNHILWNSVSFVDGRKYHADKHEYKGNIRRISDEICRENDLSIIETDVENTVNKHYAEWLADKQGHATWRSMIKEDVDDTLKWVIETSELYVDLQIKGYKLNTDGKYATVFCKGMKRPVRLKSLGEEYTRENIEKRIEDNFYGIHKETYALKKANYQYIKPPSKYDGWLVWLWWYKQYHQAMRERARPVHTSKKIRAVKKAKTLRGERLSGTYPYGYMISPDDKNKLIPNPDTAPIIKKIFEMYSKGKRIADIQRWLKKDKVLTPYAYLHSITGCEGYGKVIDNPYTWVPSTIFSILDRVEYIGHIAANKGRNISYKNQRRVLNDKKDWLIFENAHEPLIDQSTWDGVRKRRATITRPKRAGTVNKLSGLLFCADCGRKMYFKQNVKSKYNYEYYVCSGYNNKKECTTHSIKKSLVKSVILNDLQRITSITQQFEDCYLVDIMLKDIEKELENNDNNHAKLHEAKNRIDEIDMIIKRLYEDNVIGKITNERFMQLNNEYETEQYKLKEELSELENQVNKNRYIVREKKDFLHLVRKYTDIKELEYDVVRELIEKVMIHDHPTNDEPRQIDIYYRFAGKVNYHYMLEDKEVDAV